VPDREDHPGTLVVPMGNYVSGRVGNYVIVNPLQVGNSVIADMPDLLARPDHRRDHERDHERDRDADEDKETDRALPDPHRHAELSAHTTSKRA